MFLSSSKRGHAHSMRWMSLRTAQGVRTGWRCKCTGEGTEFQSRQSFFTIYLLRNYMKAERPDNVLWGRQRMRVHLINDSWRCAACTESLNRSRVRHTFGAAGAAASPPFIAFISNDDKHRARLALIIHSDGAIREPRHGYQ